MKISKNWILIIAFSVFCLSVLPSKDSGIREDLVVTNIEVPVRVVHKGELVDGLKKSDFKLYENNKLMEINGFFVNRKKIGISDPGDVHKIKKKTKISPRYFVLVYQLTDYNEAFKKGISYLFDNLLTDRDYILVFVNNKSIILDKISPQKRKEFLENTLREESIKARQQLQRYFVRIKLSLDYTKTELAMKQQSEEDLPLTTRPAQILSFLKEYLRTWKEYKRRYLVPDIDNYYRFAEFLTKINMEKWVINFYQTEMFPVLKYGGEFRQEIENIINEMLMANIEGVQYARMMRSLLTEIDLELKVARDFDSEEISRLFYKAGATFHSVISSSGKGTISRDLEYRQVSTDIENSLRQITAKTGGKLITTRDLESALNKVSKAQDIHYLLTYEPEDPKAAGKIRVKVDNKNYKVIFDNNKQADYIKKYLAKKNRGIPIVKIIKLSFSGKKLNFTINDFQKKDIGFDNKGNIKVSIKVKNKANMTIFNSTRDMASVESSIKISLDFNWLTSGNYTFLINVSDTLTGRSEFEYLKIKIE